MLANTHPAFAALTYCNRTQNPIQAALGLRQDETWKSKGWWRLEPGQCSKVLGGNLTERFYYYNAISLFKPAKDKDAYAWTGKFQFCTQNQPFDIEGDGDCESKGFITRGFQEIEPGANVRDYTLDFKDSSSY